MCTEKRLYALLGIWLLNMQSLISSLPVCNIYSSLSARVPSNFWSCSLSSDTVDIGLRVSDSEFLKILWKYAAGCMQERHN